MIAFVRGPVRHVGVDSAVVEVGGLGISVLCAPATLAGLRTEEEAQLATSMVVREDSLTLYGFADDDARGVFELLLTASGVGPKLAQAMLAVHEPDELRRAVASEDLVALTKVPGVGRKGAQRIVLELKDRLGPPRGAVTRGAATDDGAAGVVPAAPTWMEQVRGALINLGWPAREADTAVAAVRPLAAEVSADGTDPDVAVLLRAALRTLSQA